MQHQVTDIQHDQHIATAHCCPHSVVNFLAIPSAKRAIENIVHKRPKKTASNIKKIRDQYEEIGPFPVKPVMPNGRVRHGVI